MLPRNHPGRIRIVFDDHRLVANAGLLLPATLAGHLGLRELVDHHLDLGGAPGRANTGDKLMTLVASAMAGGDCIDDADVLRTEGTACTLGGTVKAPSTLGTFLRSFRWGHVRQLDRVSRELLARAWAAGAGPATTAIPASGAITRCWPSPPRRDRECHPRPQARCGVEPSPLGPLRRQRRLAGGTGDGPQHRPLDSAHRSGSADRDHQDPPAAVLLPGRTDHPLGAPPHTASATALALESPFRSCPGPIARPATPCLTAEAATGRHQANRPSPRTRASPVCVCLLLRSLPAISP